MQIIKQKIVHPTMLILSNSNLEVIASNYLFVEELFPRRSNRKSGGSRYITIVKK